MNVQDIGPFRMETRLHVHAIIDARGEVAFIDTEPRFHNGEPCGSITSRGRTAEELRAIARLLTGAPDLLRTLRALTDWAREHTSPRDANSPHQLIIDAMEAIDRVNPEPVRWHETTAEQFEEMLGCVPPELRIRGGFLVGEPCDHFSVTGAPRFRGYLQRGERFYRSSRPLTCAEFRTVEMP
jgi:hypothetical protein